MPVYLRTFYVQKLNKMFVDQKKEAEKQMKTSKSSIAKAPKIPRR